MTGPIRRLCRRLASRGLIVASPESYHEFEVAGTVLPYDEAGTDSGRAPPLQCSATSLSTLNLQGTPTSV